MVDPLADERTARTMDVAAVISALGYLTGWRLRLLRRVARALLSRDARKLLEAGDDALLHRLGDGAEDASEAQEQPGVVVVEGQRCPGDGPVRLT